MTDWFVDRARAAFVALFEALAESVVALLAWIIRFVDVHTRPDLGAEWFVDVASTMFGLAFWVMAPMFVIAVVEGVVAGRSGWLARPVKMLFVAALAGSVSLIVVDQLLAVTDWMAAAITDGVREDMTSGVAGLSALFGATGGASAAGAAAAGASLSGPLLMVGILSAGALLVLLLGAFVVLKLREAAILLITVFLLLAFASLLWHRAAPWFGRLTRALLALIVCKVPIVLAFALGASALNGAFAQFGTETVAASSADQTGILMSVLATAVAMLALAVVSPIAVVRLFDFVGGQAVSAISERVSVSRATQTAAKVRQVGTSTSQRFDTLTQQARNVSWRPGGGGTAATSGAGAAAGAGTAAAGVAGVAGVAAWGAGKVRQARDGVGTVASSASDGAASSDEPTGGGKASRSEPAHVEARPAAPARPRATDLREERDASIRRIVVAGQQAVNDGKIGEAQSLLGMARRVDAGDVRPDSVAQRPEEIRRQALAHERARQAAHYGYTTVTAEAWPPRTDRQGRIKAPQPNRDRGRT